MKGKQTEFKSKHTDSQSSPTLHDMIKDKNKLQIRNDEKTDNNWATVSHITGIHSDPAAGYQTNHVLPLLSESQPSVTAPFQLLCSAVLL